MMLRTTTAFAAFGLLALVFAIGLYGANTAISGYSPGEQVGMPMINSRSGQPITLEMVQRDIDWHRETAARLRGIN